METINHNKMWHFFHYIYSHLEAIVGTSTGVVIGIIPFDYLYLFTNLVHTDRFTEMVFKFIIAVMCGFGGALGTAALKALISLFKKEEEKKD